MAREIIAAEKPKFIVMMIGNNDRQSIRENAPPARAPGPGRRQGERRSRRSSRRSRATPAPPAPRAQTSTRSSSRRKPRGRRAAADRRPSRRGRSSYGPWEFHTEKWEVAYIKRVDATIAALKSAGVPVIWVGLPSQRGPKASTDSAYLNEIYRSRAEKAGITYVDIWDGFVDEGGRFSPQGPDYEGQTRRLRTGDGVYFTKFGARKLAHYVEREIQRHIANRASPVALAGAGRAPGRSAECQAGRSRAAAGGRPGGAAHRAKAGRKSCSAAARRRRARRRSTPPPPAC